MGPQIVAYAVLVPIFSVLMIVTLILGIQRQRWWVVGGAVWVVMLLVAFFVIGFVFNWFPASALEPCSGPPQFCYCEIRQTTGTIQQVESVWANLAFMAAGLIVLYLAGGQGSPGPNPMADSRSYYPRLLGMVIIFLGPASMFLHASFRNWAGWFDSMSIIFWLAFNIWYTIARLYRWGWIRFLLGYLLTLVVIGLFDVFVTTSRTWWVLGLGVFWGVLELLIVVWPRLRIVVWLRSRIVVWPSMAEPVKGVQRDWKLYTATLGTFLFAFFLFWIWSGNLGYSLCYGGPDSPIQPHAIWHMLGALVTVFGYVYFATEQAKSGLGNPLRIEVLPKP